MVNFIISSDNEWVSAERHVLFPGMKHKDAAPQDNMCVIAEVVITKLPSLSRSVTAKNESKQCRSAGHFPSATGKETRPCPTPTMNYSTASDAATKRTVSATPNCSSSFAPPPYPPVLHPPISSLRSNFIFTSAQDPGSERAGSGRADGRRPTRLGVPLSLLAVGPQTIHLCQRQSISRPSSCSSSPSSLTPVGPVSMERQC